MSKPCFSILKSKQHKKKEVIHRATKSVYKALNTVLEHLLTSQIKYFYSHIGEQRSMQYNLN